MKRKVIIDIELSNSIKENSVAIYDKDKSCFVLVPKTELLCGLQNQIIELKKEIKAAQEEIEKLYAVISEVSSINEV